MPIAWFKSASSAMIHFIQFSVSRCMIWQCPKPMCTNYVCSINLLVAWQNESWSIKFLSSASQQLDNSCGHSSGLGCPHSLPWVKSIAGILAEIIQNMPKPSKTHSSNLFDLVGAVFSKALIAKSAQVRTRSAHATNDKENVLELKV